MNESIEDKTTKVQEDRIFNLKRDDGSTKSGFKVGSAWQFRKSERDRWISEQEQNSEDKQ